MTYSTPDFYRKFKLFLKEFFIPKFKFALTSSVATAVDYGSYLLLVNNLFSPVISNIISQTSGIIVNFILQKRFVFLMKRNLYAAFFLSILFSLIGLGLGTSFIYLLNKHEFFSVHQYITKFIVTGFIFFYNFYTKRFAFEKKIISRKS
ncbi:MAG: GtrA family protein [Bacteroidales bacterium]|nr:GtrA family protein [Bacteroidales bacterium]